MYFLFNLINKKDNGEFNSHTNCHYCNVLNVNNNNSIQRHVIWRYTFIMSTTFGGTCRPAELDIRRYSLKT